jgi:metal-responsive CopG/Arc/MetJ family transcriptional regulator
MEEKKAWGGKRNGSGRKRKADSTIISIKLNNDLLEAFPKEVKDKDGKVTKLNRSDYINDAVRSKMIADGWM